MLMHRVIACLDVRDGRVVKGVQFQNLRDSGDPAELARRYQQEGADEITLLDISATPQGRSTAADTVAKVRAALAIPLTVGGGVRSEQDAARLLDAGADKVAINTAAVLQPDLISRCADRFGSQCIVIAIDAARTATNTPSWFVRTRSGENKTPLDAVAWAAQSAAAGAGEVLLTSWDRDGTRSGYDLELTRAVASAVPVPIIASGGAANPHHLLEAIHAGADAVLAAGIFHDGEWTVNQVKKFLQTNRVEVRL